jgi:general secretion pathway protein E
MTPTTARDPRTLRPELLPNFTKRLQDAVAEDSGRVLSGDFAASLVAESVGLGASDIHLNPHSNGFRLRLRVDGIVWDVAHLNTDHGKMLVNQFKALANLDPIVRFNPRDAHAAVQVEGCPIHLRLALAPSLDRDTLTVRLLDPRRLERSIGELGFGRESFEALHAWLESVNGMFLTTGPSGSGKTTTLYALLDHLKQSNRVIVTLEDPVEYQVDSIAQVQIDELHHLQFSDGLKALLRHDPDFIMIGEVRDSVTAHTAVSAAIAGRVLLSTLHARDAVGAVTALRNWRLGDHEIAESVSVVVAQRLVRKICLNCCERRSLTNEEAAWFEAAELQAPAHLWEGAGCDHCRNLGYKGRTGVFELWRLDESDYQLILRHTDEHRLRMHLAERGHRFLANEAIAKLDQGITTLAEVKKVTAGLISTPHPSYASVAA